MAVNNMTETDFKSAREAVFENLSTDSGYDDPILVPRGVKKISYVFSPAAAGSGYVQISLSSHDDIIAGNGIWYTWDAGNVSVLTSDESGPVKGIKHVNVSGTTRLQVVGLH